MRHLLRAHFVAFALCAWPLNASPMSVFKHGDAAIVVRKSKPCFYVPLDHETKAREYFFDSLIVESLVEPGKPAWMASTHDVDAKSTVRPNGPAKCIEYGVPPRDSATQLAQILAFEVPYGVLITVSTRSSLENNRTRRYMTNFCLKLDRNRDTIIVKAERNLDTRKYWCSDTAISAKP